MITILTHGMAGVVGIVLGAYGYYRWGPALRADVQKVETAVTNFKGNKASGK